MRCGSPTSSTERPPGPGSSEPNAPAPQDVATEEGASKHGAAEEGASKEGATEEGASKEGATEGGAPNDAAPTDDASKDDPAQDGAAQDVRPRSWLEWLVGPSTATPGFLCARWVFLRGLAVCFASAFVSLWFQIHGLIGPRGILPAGDYLASLREGLTLPARLWYAPTLLWLSSGNAALWVLVIVGLLASLALLVNLWPRGSIAVAGLAFLSFIAAAQDFASYQSDGMLLEAAFVSLFFAPRGWRPGLGAATPPSRASLFLLRWEWFRIYFESGVVKLLSGDPQWRSLTAMDEYYQNGPLPTWIGWYVQHLPHGFHAFSAGATLAIELLVVWLGWLPRRFKLVCFAICTTLQVGIILTANYAFLNYLVLFLGFLLVDDAAFARISPVRISPVRISPVSISPVRYRWVLWAQAVVLGWQLYATVAAFLFAGTLALPQRLLGPFRIANAYGLFAVMTTARYEVELQGTLDGKTWVPYPFRWKPQDPGVAPGIYAPYQPRFEWNLWFATLGDLEEYPWVTNVEQKLLEREPSVLSLFARDPFDGKTPRAVRAVEWRYWFTTLDEKRRTGLWWHRGELREYAPPVGETEPPAAAAPSGP
jgi:hypothetical protein